MKHDFFDLNMNDKAQKRMKSARESLKNGLVLSPKRENQAESLEIKIKEEMKKPDLKFEELLNSSRLRS